MNQNLLSVNVDYESTDYKSQI